MVAAGVGCSFCQEPAPSDAVVCAACGCPLRAGPPGPLPPELLWDALPGLFDDDRWLLPQRDGLDWFVRGSVTSLRLLLLPDRSALKLKVSAAVAQVPDPAAAARLAARLRRLLPAGLFVASGDLISCRFTLTLSAADVGLVPAASVLLLLSVDMAAQARRMLSADLPSGVTVAQVPHPQMGFSPDGGPLLPDLLGDDGDWLAGRWPAVLAAATRALESRGLLPHGQGRFELPLPTRPQVALRFAPASERSPVPGTAGVTLPVVLAPPSRQFVALGPAEMNAVDLLLLDRLPASMLSSVSADDADVRGLTCGLWLPAAALGPSELPDLRLGEVLAELAGHLLTAPLSWVQSAVDGA